jgi:ATP-dependent RNA circularization protein (DNA/RNA ligase family)
MMTVLLFNKPVRYTSHRDRLTEAKYFGEYASVSLLTEANHQHFDVSRKYYVAQVMRTGWRQPSSDLSDFAHVAQDLLPGQLGC